MVPVLIPHFNPCPSVPQPACLVTTLWPRQCSCIVIEQWRGEGGLCEYLLIYPQSLKFDSGRQWARSTSVDWQDFRGVRVATSSASLHRPFAGTGPVKSCMSAARVPAFSDDEPSGLSEIQDLFKISECVGHGGLGAPLWNSRHSSKPNGYCLVGLCTDSSGIIFFFYGVPFSIP